MSGASLNGGKKENPTGDKEDLNYRVGRRGSSIDKLPPDERYFLLEDIFHSVMYPLKRRLRYDRAIEAKEAGETYAPFDKSMDIDAIVTRLEDAKDFDPVAHIEQEIKKRMATIDRNHAEIEVLLKVREMIDAIENPPKSGEQSSAKRGS